MSAMFTPESPSTVPTRPMTPGRSSLRTNTMWGDGGTSTVWPSTSTSRGSERRPTSVPETEWPPPDTVIRFTQSREVTDVVSRISMPRSVATWGALT